MSASPTQRVRDLVTGFLDRLDASGLNRSELRILSAVRDGELATVSELAGRVGLASATVSRDVRELERQGLVTRRMYAQNGGRVSVRLTSAGRELLALLERDLKSVAEMSRRR